MTNGSGTFLGGTPFFTGGQTPSGKNTANAMPPSFAQAVSTAFKESSSLSLPRQLADMVMRQPAQQAIDIQVRVISAQNLGKFIDIALQSDEGVIRLQIKPDSLPAPLPANMMIKLSLGQADGTPRILQANIPPQQQAAPLPATTTGQAVQTQTMSIPPNLLQTPLQIGGQAIGTLLPAQQSAQSQAAAPLVTLGGAATTTGAISVPVTQLGWPQPTGWPAQAQSQPAMILQINAITPPAGNGGSVQTQTPQAALPATAATAKPAAQLVGNTPTVTSAPINGTVTGVAGTQNLPVISSPAGSFMVLTQTPLPVNTQISFQLVAPAQMAQPTATMTVPTIQNGWPALEETAQLLSLTLMPPTGAQTHDAAVLPRPTASLPTTTLFFLAALKMGDFSAWLGHGTMDQIKQKMTDTQIKRLEQDFRTLVKDGIEPQSGTQWRIHSMPILNHDQQIQMIEIITRQNRQESDGQGDGSDANGQDDVATRFLVNLNLSRMGLMQIDGLMVRKNLDIAIKSFATLEPELKQELKGGYHTVLEHLGMTGQLIFQNRDTWMTVIPNDALDSHTPEGGAIV